ncbi:low-specificity L-threonine aldolase [Desulfospira joergensenii]|uniref:low-specificity L-threonine aldolase n=1 Tax=Desulfospira joergensenii TaxID=53329 RepID=UPI0003B3171C|nr:low-specificity L-threonine aldolase [Desulfospira joergensenii]
MKWIDLRSDTVTRPTREMMDAMMSAEVGDDVYGEDPSINRLEEVAAQTLGTESALFCSSGTQSNLLALLSHCARGDEYIAGQAAHTYRYEAGGGAVIGSIQPQPIEFEPDGSLDLEKVARFIKPDDFHFAKTRLLCLENTQGGKVLPMAYLKQAREFAHRHNLSFHLDGARVFNAAVKLNLDVREITRYFDTISCCLSKGLGAPVGSVLCGPDPLIKRARRWRKMVGGGMRQAGILAAAGEYALTRHVDRLADDHENALRLARGLSDIPGVEVDLGWVHTNILFADMDADMDVLSAHMKERGILIDNSKHLRLVTHLDVDPEDVEKALEAFKEFFA